MSAAADGGENLSQIREILFGRQMEIYDGRFSHLEDRITSVTGSMRAEFAERLGELEAMVGRELKSLAKDLRSEQEKSAAAIRKELETARSDLQRGLDTLRKEFTAQVKSLHDALADEHEHATQMITREATDIREQKVDRTMLAALLKDVSAQLDSHQESQAEAQEG